MKITRIELSEEEQKLIFDTLIKEFDDQTESAQKVEFKLNDSATIESELTLSIEGSELDENNQGYIISRYVNNFEYWVMIEGESVDVDFARVRFYNEILQKHQSRSAESMLYRIEQYYSNLK